VGRAPEVVQRNSVLTNQCAKNTISFDSVIIRADSVALICRLRPGTRLERLLSILMQQDRVAGTGQLLFGLLGSRAEGWIREEIVTLGGGRWEKE